MVESQPSTLLVASSILVPRSISEALIAQFNQERFVQERFVAFNFLRII